MMIQFQQIFTITFSLWQILLFVLNSVTNRSALSVHQIYSLMLLVKEQRGVSTYLNDILWFDMAKQGNLIPIIACTSMKILARLELSAQTSM